MWRLRTSARTALQRQTTATLLSRRIANSATTHAPDQATAPVSFTPRVSASSALRSSFLGYFQSNSHQLLASSSLVPNASDETLLFTNAGMVQLKDMLVGVQPPPAGSNGRLVSAQKCIRAGGKHNDLENVGYTARHHTFFEMMGNFSIGNYFKEEAMTLAWNYLTKELGLPPSRLRISIHTSDDESALLWSKITGFSETAPGPGGVIVRLGDADNFWSMGDSPGTPCGPCSEIFFDQGTEVDGDRWLEIWNLVFMQYARGAAPGELVPLAKPCVDTGMGLERVAAVLQHQPTNYDSDLLRPSIDAARALALARTNAPPSALPYVDGLDPAPHATALKVIVDHVRSAAFLLAEGVVPSNVGRGYVLRRIIRRAVRYGTTLGLDRPFMADLLDPLVASLGDAYPELRQRRDIVDAGLRQEEANFFATMHRGMRVLEDAFRKQAAVGSIKGATLPGEVAFLLYDSFGFPLDLTEVIARERGAVVDTNRFDELMKQQREQSKGVAFQTSSSTSSGVTAQTTPEEDDAPPAANVPAPAELKQWQSSGITNNFIGYETLSTRAPVRVLAAHHAPTTRSLWLALDETPFYASGGGQVGDIGELELHDGTKLAVIDCVRPYDACSVIRVHLPTTQASFVDFLRPGAIIKSARVDAAHRAGVAAHHTATHLLHAALKVVLPLTSAEAASASKKKSSAPALTAASINQAGSLVAHDRLRFDFSCPTAITPAQIAAVEAWINAALISEDAASADATSGLVLTDVMSKEDALAKGATALFGEKYGDAVRVVSIPGYSVELCGGTHVRRLRAAYPVKILGDAVSIASGVRRLEAVAGPHAVRLLERDASELRRAAAELKVQPDAVANSVSRAQARVKELEDEVRTLKAQAMIADAEANGRTRDVALKWKGCEAPLAVKIHEVAQELAAAPGVLRDACTFLLGSQPGVYHLLLVPSTGGVAMAAGFAQQEGQPAVTAKQLWQRIEGACTRAGPESKPKGGGSNQIAQGLLPIVYTESPQIALIEMVIAALQQD